MNRRAGPRERILHAGGDLLYSHGIVASGVDRIAEVSGVSKRSLYQHFGSKDALVAAYLEDRDAPTRARLTAGAEAAASDPRGQLVALFTVLTDWLLAPDFRGCPYINAAAELSDPTLPARAVVRRHKEQLREWIRARAVTAGLSDPDELSWQLMALLDGAVAQRLVLDDAPIAPVVAAARALVVTASAGTGWFEVDTGAEAPRGF